VRFDGQEGSEGRILLAIGGIVFDVTAGRNFYGPRRSLFPFFLLLLVIGVSTVSKTESEFFF
jgi:hypothetical protein